MTGDRDPEPMIRGYLDFARAGEVCRQPDCARPAAGAVVMPEFLGSPFAPDGRAPFCERHAVELPPVIRPAWLAMAC